MKLTQSIKAIKALLSSVKLSQEPLENGSLIQYDGDKIAVGDVVYLTTGEGNWSVLPDGSYQTKKGGSFVITNGTVESVKDNTAAPAEEKPVKQAQAKAEDTAKKPPYGDVEYADPGFQKDKKARYPIDTEQHIRAAWNYIHKPKNEESYSADDLAKVKGAIETAWKKKISPDGPPAEAKAQEDMNEDGTLMDYSDEKKGEKAEVKAAADSTGTGGDVETADSPANVTMDDASGSTEVPAVATVDVGDLIDAKLQPVFQQIYDLQSLVSSLKDLVSVQKTAMSAITDVVDKIANQPAGKAIETEVANPFRKEDQDIKKTREWQIMHAQ